VAEKKLASKFLENITLDTGLVVFGVEDTMKALEMYALESLIINEEL